MSKYRITLEGKTYEMEIELVEDQLTSAPPVRNSYREFKSPGKDPTVRVMDPSAQKQTVSHIGSVPAPMPGIVLKVKKNPGDAVKTGDIVLILEAMKMENEIPAPIDGIIKAVNCAQGGTVAAGDILFEVE